MVIKALDEYTFDAPQVVLRRQYVLLKVLVVKPCVVTPVVLHVEPSGEDSHKYVNPLATVAPVTERLKFDPAH